MTPEEHLEAARDLINQDKEKHIARCDFDTACLFRDAGHAIDKASELLKRVPKEEKKKPHQGTGE